MMQVYDHRVCTLGEGPFWHPTRKQMFWFDILGQKMLSQSADGPQDWGFDEMVSAGGWVDNDTLLLASETALSTFNLATCNYETVVPLERDNPVTRSNDGRADPMGGFWIGTMGKEAEVGAGAIYRLYKGELRQLVPNLTIPNAICFAPGGRSAYFTDTVTRIVNRIALDPQGWPCAEPQPFIDFRSEGLNPDGAVVDAAGNLWVALWGAARLIAIDPHGHRIRAISLAAPHVTCPAFGGEDLSTLYCTSATQGMQTGSLAAHPDAGKVFTIDAKAKGLAEPQVLL